MAREDFVATVCDQLLGICSGEMDEGSRVGGSWDDYEDSAGLIADLNSGWWYRLVRFFDGQRPGYAPQAGR